MIASPPSSPPSPTPGSRTPRPSAALPPIAPAISSGSSPGCARRAPSQRRLCMPAPSSYDYALIRVVPLVERGECLNVGAVLFCRTRRFLRAAIELGAHHRATLAALAPDLDLEDVRRHLAAIPRLAAGDPAAGPIARLSQA